MVDVNHCAVLLFHLHYQAIVHHHHIHHYQTQCHVTVEVNHCAVMSVEN